jgi:hypothetical protein
VIKKRTATTRAIVPENSRRDFLKSGAALVGAVLLGKTFVGSSVSAAQVNRRAAEPQDLYAFLKGPVGLSGNDIRNLKADKVIIKSLDSQAKHEVVIGGIARVKAPMAFCLQQYGKEGMTIETAAAEAQGTFSNPASLADTENLMLPPADIKDLMRCKPGDCKMKVPETAYKNIAQWKREGDSASTKANAMFREAVVEYVNAYLKDGNDALIEYYDKKQPVKLAAEFRELLGQAKYLYEYVPELHKYLEKFPHAQLTNSKNIFYWKKEKFGEKADRAVISLNHLVMFERSDGVPKVVAATKQIYATHYFEAAFEITAMEKDPEAPQSNTYLVFVNRSRLDVMRGLPGFLKKAVINGARDLLHEKMRVVKGHLESAYS